MKFQDGNSSGLCIPNVELGIIQRLNEYKVRYLIIGGYAMLFHGFEDREVNDIDIWIDNELDNAHHCYDALNSFPDINFNFDPSYLCKPGLIVSNAFYNFEIFTSMDGADFDESFSRCGTYTKDDEQIYFISPSDHLKIKRIVYKKYFKKMDKEKRDIVFLKNIIKKKNEQ